MPARMSVTAALLASALSATVLAHPLEFQTNSLDERGFSLSLTNQVQHPWANNRIDWCVVDPATADEFQSLIRDSLKLWQDAAGGPLNFPVLMNYAGACNGANPANMLAVTKLADTDTARTSAGADFQNKGTLAINTVPNYGARDGVVNMAHELGHAFGLVHEHQRPGCQANIGTDLTKPIAFFCGNLKDYDDFSNRGENMAILCTDQRQAALAGFSGADVIQYVQNDGYMASADFDWDSIMLYQSITGGKTVNGVVQQVIARQQPDGSRTAIPQNTVPSAGDIAQVRALYPNASVDTTGTASNETAPAVRR